MRAAAEFAASIAFALRSARSASSMSDEYWKGCAFMITP